MGAQKTAPAFLDHLREIFAWDACAAADEQQPRDAFLPDSRAAGHSGEEKGESVK